MKAKAVKKLISDKMTSRSNGRTVVLGESDPDHDRIEIKYPKGDVHISLNPIKDILKKHNFYVAQIIDWYYPTKMVILLIRNPERKK